ncbi:MAG: hypothetical protein K2W96_06800 [Gemmataceae bacterium]|nr:hypothetical protein [Gemmataceae bacterium]
MAVGQGDFRAEVALAVEAQEEGEGLASHGEDVPEDGEFGLVGGQAVLRGLAGHLGQGGGQAGQRSGRKGVAGFDVVRHHVGGFRREIAGG